MSENAYENGRNEKNIKTVLLPNAKHKTCTVEIQWRGAYTCDNLHIGKPIPNMRSHNAQPLSSINDPRGA